MIPVEIFAPGRIMRRVAGLSCEEHSRPDIAFNSGTSLDTKQSFVSGSAPMRTISIQGVRCYLFLLKWRRTWYIRVYPVVPTTG
jgi:hypothetical protein